MLVEPQALLAAHDYVIFDCRFSLADETAGHNAYLHGHIPGAYYLNLNRDLSGPTETHGGRHPLPDLEKFIATMAALGVEADTQVVAYDDSRLGFAARLWWLMCSAGYKSPLLLNGGFAGYLAVGGEVEKAVPEARALTLPATSSSAHSAFRGVCDIDGLRLAQEAGASLIDSREEPRYQGLEEPIDPIAGHIPGAINRPWQGVTDDAGRVLDKSGLEAHWGEALEAKDLVIYCGSGVTACVNLFALALLGKEDATLYAGSWSDWCSYL